MATVTYFVDGAVERKFLGGQMVVAENLIDFTKKNCASADVVQCLNIPANAIVLMARCIVKTAEGGTATATFGDDAGAGSWDASVNLNATAGTMTTGISGTDAYALNYAGKFYATANTLDLTLANACDAAKVVVMAHYFLTETYA